MGLVNRAHNTMLVAHIGTGTSAVAAAFRVSEIDAHDGGVDVCAHAETEGPPTTSASPACWRVLEGHTQAIS